MELFGLKDIDGNEYKILLPDNNIPPPFDKGWSYSFGSQLKIEPIKSHPEFKVGDWIIARNLDIGKIKTISSSGMMIHTDNFDVFTRLCRPATTQEIELHLKKICDEKGYKKGTRIKCVLFPERGLFKLSGNFTYWQEYDRLIDSYVENENYVPIVYNQGKFAEIIPEIIPEIKELPKNVDELKELLQKFWEYKYKGYGLDIFLEEQGYKTK